MAISATRAGRGWPREPVSQIPAAIIIHIHGSTMKIASP
jgi:hypothetical protein